jgi:hypothetical protein
MAVDVLFKAYQWYHSHADPIWPPVPLNSKKKPSSMKLDKNQMGILFFCYWKSTCNEMFWMHFA